MEGQLGMLWSVTQAGRAKCPDVVIQEGFLSPSCVCVCVLVCICVHLSLDHSVTSYPFHEPLLRAWQAS